MSKKAPFTKMVRMVGGVLVVTIPVEVVKALELEPGQYVSVIMEKVE